MPNPGGSQVGEHHRGPAKQAAEEAENFPNQQMQQRVLEGAQWRLKRDGGGRACRGWLEQLVYNLVSYLSTIDIILSRGFFLGCLVYTV